MSVNLIRNAKDISPNKTKTTAMESMHRNHSTSYNKFLKNFKYSIIFDALVQRMHCIS